MYSFFSPMTLNNDLLMLLPNPFTVPCIHFPHFPPESITLARHHCLPCRSIPHPYRISQISWTSLQQHQLFAPSEGRALFIMTISLTGIQLQEGKFIVFSGKGPSQCLKIIIQFLTFSHMPVCSYHVGKLCQAHPWRSEKSHVGPQGSSQPL